jgi:hypothetical protein
MKHQTLLISILFIFLVAAGCKPKASCVSSGGGKGGTATISITPTHFNSYVDSCMVYVKYGTLNTPADGIYDDSVRCVLVDTIPVATFTNLKAGLYYFYGQGYHQAPFNAYVKGAANYTMCSEHNQSLYLPTDQYFP